jgi:hypothetical protein
MSFSSDPLWNSTRIFEPSFGANLNDPLGADWGMLTTCTTPRDIAVWSPTEAYVPWVYPHFLGEQIAHFMEDTHAFTMPQSAYTGWRISCDIRYSDQSIPPRTEGSGANFIMGVMSSTGTLLSYVQLLNWLFGAGDTWEFRSSAGTPIFFSPLSTNRYYRIGLQKLGTKLSAWFNPTPGSAAPITPTGVAGNSGLVKLHETIILPTYATDLYLGFYGGANYVAPDGGDYNRGGLAFPWVEELALSMMGGVSPGLPTEPINLPSGGTTGLPGGWGGGYPPLGAPSITMRRLAEDGAYHRYKNVRTAMAIYNNLRLDQ